MAGALHDEPDAAQLPGQAGPRGLAPRAGRRHRPPAHLQRRADVHVHDQAGPSLQRRLGGDRSSVQARLRARREPAAGLTRDRVPARRRRRRRAQRRQGGLGQRRRRERSDADDPPRPGESDLPRRSGDALLRRGEAEHGDRRQGDQRLSLRRPVPDRQPAGRQPGRARAEPLLQGEPPRERRTGS